MPTLFQDARFLDFGPSGCIPREWDARTGRAAGVRTSMLRTQIRLLAPRQPGIYGMLDCDEQLIYVGKAKNLRVRLLSYFRKKGRPRKAGRIIAHAKSILWEVAPSEFASLLRELELIRRWRPRWNVHGQPLRRRLAFVCIGRAPAPYLYLSRTISARVQAAFGPITMGPTAQEAVRRLNDWFQLRDCPQPTEMIFPDQGDLFPGIRPPGCLRLDIGTCLGPCTGTCTRGDYQAKANQSRDFLTGRDTSLLGRMQLEMQAASETQDFERAAVLRDRLNILTWLADRLERARKAQAEMSFIYPVASADGQVMWHLIHGARPIGVMLAPTDAASREQAREMLDNVYRRRAGLLDSYEHADSMMTVMQWFRKRPSERKRCFSPDEAVD